jgi:hypothetical protein
MIYTHSSQVAETFMMNHHTPQNSKWFGSWCSEAPLGTVVTKIHGAAEDLCLNVTGGFYRMFLHSFTSFNNDFHLLINCLIVVTASEPFCIATCAHLIESRSVLNMTLNSCVFYLMLNGLAIYVNCWLSYLHHQSLS